MSSCSLHPLLVFSVSLLLSSALVLGFKGITVENPVLDATPIRFSSKDDISCDRIQVSGHSRLKLGRYAVVRKVTLTPVSIPERLHDRIQVRKLVCNLLRDKIVQKYHGQCRIANAFRNASLGLCHCGEDEWRTLQKGLWNSVMSPYDNKYVDVKFIGDVSGSVTVSTLEENQGWRLLFLALGCTLWLLAPFVSSWVPFYYSSSMAIGIFLVIIIILFQGMKLLPTGRKSYFYLTIYGSALGAGSFLLHQFSTLVNSILVNFGLSEDAHNPVAVFTFLGIMISGAAFGYWIVRRFVITKDGSVDVTIAQFVKWATRLIAATFIFQSTLDTLLSIGALASCCAFCSMLPSPRQDGQKQTEFIDSFSAYKRRQVMARQRRAEFLSRSPTNYNRRESLWNSLDSLPAWSNSPPTRGVVRSPSVMDRSDYYSSFHKTKNRRKFTKQEWEDFSRESTREAVAELAGSAEFSDWMIRHADRLKVVPVDSSDESVGSRSSTTDEDDHAVSGSRFGFFWQ